MLKKAKILPVPKKPITVDGWKQVSLYPTNEPMVPLGLFTTYPHNLVHTDGVYTAETISSPYPSGGLKGSLLTSFVRRGVAERIEKARKLLPKGYTFVVWDAFRTLEVQQALFDWFYNQLKLKEPDFSDQELLDEAQKFVSLPSNDPARPSPHNTGAVVDLGIIKVSRKVWRQLERQARLVSNSSWQEIYRFEMWKAKVFREAELLPMGTMFDEVSEKTLSNYYEFNPTVSRECLNNRRLLYSVMLASGFENYEEEWWHFSYSDQFWAKKQGCSAFYGASILSEDNLWWERNVRIGHYYRNLAWSSGREVQSSKVSFTLSFARSVVKAGFGELSYTTQPQSCIIQP